MSTSDEEVIVFGGSFNPPHLGHVLGACLLLATEPSHRLLIVPTYRHPFQKELASFEDRLAMCRLAFEDLCRTEVTSIEAELGDESYTIRTVEALAGRFPGARFAVAAGSDALAERPMWHRIDELNQKVRWIALGRAGHASTLDPILLPEVSSTRIRSRLYAGDSVEGLVPVRVLRYIRDHGLYRAEPESPRTP